MWLYLNGYIICNILLFLMVTFAMDEALLSLCGWGRERGLGAMIAIWRDEREILEKGSQGGQSPRIYRK